MLLGSSRVKWMQGRQETDWAHLAMNAFALLPKRALSSELKLAIKTMS